MNLFVYRNTAVEYLFKGENIEYSGYSEIVSKSNDKDILMLYFLPYTNNIDELLTFINDYKNRVEYIQKNNTNKKIFVLTLYNYFYANMVFCDNRLDNAINDFNNYIIESKVINAICLEEFYKRYGTLLLFDSKYYYLYNTIINPKYASEFKEWLNEELNLIQRTRKKCLVLDLDNTLWGGILGEDGIENLNISGSYPGNCFLDFHKLILDLKNNGIVLCICSKNNYDDVVNCFNKRDDLILKMEDFSIISCCWDNKAIQISNIVEKLNIGLDSLVFVDDNPTERELVNQALPDVTVLGFPEEPYLIVDYFKNEFRKYFGINDLTIDDLNKAKQYEYKIKSDELKNSILNEEEFIRQLNIKIEYQCMNQYNEIRFEQLINKTNQFNLTTKRYKLKDLKDILANGGFIYGIKVEDKFGDLGITGIAILKIDGEEAIIDSFMLSCRILGRKIENEFLKFIMNIAFEKGFKIIKSSYIKTPKNVQTENFYKDFGFDVISSDEIKTNYQYIMKDKFTFDDKYRIEG